MKLIHLSKLGLGTVLGTVLALAAGGLAGTPAAGATPAPSAAYLQQFTRTGGNPPGLVRQPLDDPAQYTVIDGGPQDTLGLDFGPSAQVLYALEAGVLGTLDTSDNVFTPLGPNGGRLVPPTGQLWAGLSIDPRTGAAYGVSHTTSGTAASSITPIDLGAATASTSTTLTGVTRITSTSIGCAGQMYGVDSDSGKLYTIDPGTGHTTVVGPLGGGLTLGDQVGLDFDNATGKLYLWAPSGEFGTLDTGTGAFTRISGSPAGSFEAAIASTCPDTTPPDTAIASPTPGQVVPGPLVQVHLTSTEAGSTFRCSVDGKAYAACIPDKTLTLPDGVHSLSVRATDAAGNPDPTPASVAFRVDSTPPDTSIVSGPAYGAVTAKRTTTFVFTSTETSSTFLCSVDGRAYGACPSPYGVPLADGLHSFQVAAVDRAGNVDGSPATRNFRVDTRAPQTRITAGPKQHSVVHRATVTFRFTSSESPSHFRCTLDGSRLKGCTSPRKLTLANGRHTFTVAAIDSVGNRDATPVKRAFRVKRRRR